MKRQSKEFVADVISKFLRGELHAYELDDFITIPIQDVALRPVQDKIGEIMQRFIEAGGGELLLSEADRASLETLLRSLELTTEGQ